MSIISTFDDKTEAIFNPTDNVKPIKDFPEVVIMVFYERFINYMQEDYGMKIIANLNAGTFVPVYKLKYKDKEFAIIRTLIGGASTAGIAEELIALGAKKILIYGTCGTLDKDILAGHFVIPTYAYRDEGASYHYIEPSDFIKVETAEKLIGIFEKLDIPYIQGKTWTTDGLYRETRGNMEKRKKDGCVVVEMECASIMAVGKFRNVEVYQFLYGEDTLDGTKWDRRKLESSKEELMERNIVDIGFKVANEI